MIRAAILTTTILTLIYIAANQPPPVKSVQVDYCKLSTGTFAPCSGLKYRLNI